jgi:hypothetical protein
MQVHRRLAVASAVAVGAAGAVAGAQFTSTAAGAEAADTAGFGVVTQGLDIPFGLKKAVNHRGLVVAEGAGKVTRVFLDGRQETILQGAPGVAGVAGGPQRVFAVIGGPSETGAPSGGKYGSSRVLSMDYRGGHVKVVANLLRHELAHNPDGQVQFVNGQPVDALSNPFGLTWSKFGLFVADGGANDVLKVNPHTGRVTTFFAPRTFKDTPEGWAPGANANPGTTGCDPVATGVQVRGSSVYVSFLGAEAPGAGRVYKLDARTGDVQRIWKGFTSPTGIAVRPDGTVYVSHVLEGEITRIQGGERTHARVPMPTGLTVHRGKLYASAFSLAGPGQGQVVRVKARAFM